MAMTPDREPLESIIRLNSGIHTVDPSGFIMQLLRQDWDESNTDNIKPNIDHAEVHKVIKFRAPADWITVYAVAEVSEPINIGYNFTNDTYTISLDMFTSQSRRQMLRMKEEARRIILANRLNTFEDPGDADLTGRVWTAWGTSISPFDSTSKNFWRTTATVEVRWRMRAVET